MELRELSEADSLEESEDPTAELDGEDATPLIDAPLPSGTRLRNRYVLESVVGAGGTSLVYRARDGVTPSADGRGAWIAIKMLKPQFSHREESIARLKREFRQTQSLNHPNVVRIHDLDCHKGLWFLTMELLEGITLERVLQRARRVPLQSSFVRTVSDSCAAALAHAHSRAVVHGDVKPGNIFLSKDGCVRLLDFGAARTADATAAPAATWAYASPEVLSGAVPEPRDDTFSLSCVVCEMLTGQHPFGRRSSIAARDADVRIERPDGLSDEFWDDLRKGLAWQRSDRPADISRMFSKRTAASANPVSAPPPGGQTCAAMDDEAARRSTSPGRRRAWLLILARVVVIVALAAALGGSSSWSAVAAAAPMRIATANVTRPAAPSESVAAHAPDVLAESAQQPVRTSRSVVRPLVGFAAASMSVGEGTRAAALTLRRLDRNASRAEVRWRVRDGSAVAEKDFAQPLSGTAALAPGQDLRTIYIPIIDDQDHEGPEQFVVTLKATGTARTAAQSARIEVTIADDD
jgi:hypothetical protein